MNYFGVRILLEKNNSRMEYMDSAKAIGLMAVIWGHFIVSFGTWQLHTFHVPIFFIISGFFLNANKAYKEYASNKVKQMLTPYVITGLIVVALTWIIPRTVSFIAREDIGTAKDRLIGFFYGSGARYEDPAGRILEVGPIWFFLGLMWALLIVKACIGKKWGAIIVALSVFVGMYTSKIVFLPLSIQPGMVGAGYAYIGYLAKKASLKVKEKIKATDNDRGYLEKDVQWIFLFLSCALWVLYLPKVTELLFCSRCLYPLGILDGIGSLAGSAFIIMLCKMILDKIPLLSNFLHFFGKNTSIVLCVHAVDTVLIQWDWVVELLNLNLQLELLIIFLIKIAIYSGLIIVINKIKANLKS